MADDEDDKNNISAVSFESGFDGPDEPPPATETGGAGNENKGNNCGVSASDDEYVGYGHPPKRHRFPPGRSGNPKGRPRGARGLKTMLRKELGARVQVTENGKRRSLMKMEVLIKRLVEQGAKGDVKSISKLIELGGIAFGMDDETERAAKLTADEQAIIDSLMERKARSRQYKPDPRGEAPDADDSEGGEGEPREDQDGAVS